MIEQADWFGLAPGEATPPGRKTIVRGDRTYSLVPTMLQPDKDVMRYLILFNEPGKHTQYIGGFYEGEDAAMTMIDALEASR